MTRPGAAARHERRRRALVRLRENLVVLRKFEGQPDERRYPHPQIKRTLAEIETLTKVV